MSEMEHKGNNMFFYQGGKAIGGENSLKIIKQKIAELSKIKNVSFLLGAGASSGAIPSMVEMQDEIIIRKGFDEDNEIKTLYKSIDSDNLEKILTILYAKKHYL